MLAVNEFGAVLDQHWRRLRGFGRRGYRFAHKCGWCSCSRKRERADSPANAIARFENENVAHTAVGEVARGAQAGGTSANDGSWHQITIVWTASSATLTFLVDLNQEYSVSSVYGSNLPAGPGCLVLGQMGAGDCSATTGFSSYVIGSDFSGILGHVSAAGGSGQCVLGRHCCQRFQIVFKRRCCRVSVSPITAVTVPS